MLSESAIAKQISDNICSLKLPESLHIYAVKKYTFPDGYEISAKPNERILILANKYPSVGVFQFGVSKIRVPGSNADYSKEPLTITLDFVQGVKKREGDPPFPKGWQEIIVNSFILSTLPILEKNPELKVRYGEFIPFKVGNGEDRNIERKKILEDLVKEYNKIKSINPGSPRLFLLRDKILTLQNKITFVNAIRDRYFDKEGYLNPKKERVKQLFETYSQSKELKHFTYQRPKEVKKKNVLPKKRR